jgi:ATP-dependent protease HslVU (ClpYQ) peptidase subunit
MTVIVAMEHQGKVWMGADSAGIGDNFNASTRLDRKIFWNNGYLIGFAGSFRAGQIVKHKFEMPEFPIEFLPENACPEILPENICLENLPENLLLKVENFFATAFIETIQLALAESAWIKSEDESFLLLIAIGPYFAMVDEDYQIAFEAGHAAIGSGAAVAYGAMSALDCEPQEKIMKTLEIASKHNAGVRSPFYYDHT